MDDDVCAVCLEACDAGGAASFPDCGHRFHTLCLLNCAQYGVRCPVCRHVPDGVMAPGDSLMMRVEEARDAQEALDAGAELPSPDRGGHEARPLDELHPQLLDNDRYLLFHLQQQHLIELIRLQKVEDALQFAAEHLAERGEEDQGVLQELERTLALLAFEDPEVSPFSDLLSPSHRQQVASQLNAAILRAEHAESSQSQLAVSLRKMVWAQEELDRKRVRYPHMNLQTTSIEEPK